MRTRGADSPARSGTPARRPPAEAEPVCCCVWPHTPLDPASVACPPARTWYGRAWRGRVALTSLEPRLVI